MCGRFALSARTTDIEKLMPQLKKFSSDLLPRFNIAPSQKIAAVLNSSPNELSFLRWGLIPFWAKDLTIGNKLINARAETLLEKPSFKNALRKKRCVIPASGFYEWQKIDGTKLKQPYFIRLKNQDVFFFAGLWDVWKSPTNENIASATIITTQANDLMAPIHLRMPVILPSHFITAWLSEDQLAVKELCDGLNPYPSDKMTAHKVSTLVNSPANDLPELIEEIA